tara:strand:+ start:64 stop:243 length:180 start_codon:yes stop_codon:yes gene_type:complete
MSRGYYLAMVGKYTATVAMAYIAVDVAGTSAEKWLCAIMAVGIMASTVVYNSEFEEDDD